MNNICLNNQLDQLQPLSRVFLSIVQDVYFKQRFQVALVNCNQREKKMYQGYFDVMPIFNDLH